MNNRWKYVATCLLMASTLALGSCGSTATPDDGGNIDGSNNAGGDDGGNGGATTSNQVVFTPVGAALSNDLIDLEFLPGQNGEAVAISWGNSSGQGTVYYLRSDLTPLAQTASIDVGTGSEQGLLNVAADPDYVQNGYLYFYYTLPDGSGNVVVRRQVSVDVPGNTFSLGAEEVLVTFLKNNTTNPGDNHNGGSMVFGESKYLFVGVGDGAGDDPVSQDASNPLGKLHRLRFDRSDPANPVFMDDTIYSLGLRNPFTLVVDDEADLFMGDVGAGAYEEVNCVYFAGENYGWPECEGPCAPPVSDRVNPLWGYRHGDETFNNEDPEDNSSGGESIMVASFYTGSQYGGVFTNKLIYNEFFKGWVRLLTLNVFDQVTHDEHIGHIQGLTGLHQNPADGLLYGISLFGSDRIVRMDLAQ